MTHPSRIRSSTYASVFACFLVCVFLSAGCRPIEFSPNELAAAGFLQSTDSEEIKQVADRAATVMEELFGTVDNPQWPASIDPILDWDEVVRSAGPVGRDHDQVERGLFRKHCVQCHGVSGDGRGPAAAILAPYARDFRRGTFKFKSTPIGAKPTREDLVQIIESGIPGTSMPSFAPLRNREEFQHDIESLAEYVMFLSVRGETERRLIRTAAIDEDELTVELALEIAAQVVQGWRDAPSQVPEPIRVTPLEGDLLAQSVERGHAIFKSETTACYRCHGLDGAGDGVSQDYDEWTKDWTVRAGIDPAHRSEWRQMKSFGAMKPVLNQSRNLHLGALRGGRSMEEIAKRIQLGIDGTPMPSAAISPSSPHGITHEEFGDLVRYVAHITGLSAGPKARQAGGVSELSVEEGAE